MFPSLEAIAIAQADSVRAAQADPHAVRVCRAKNLRDYAAQNLADALRNVEIAQLAAKAAEAEYRAVLASAQ
jgi:hypothetical protein